MRRLLVGASLFALAAVGAQSPAQAQQSGASASGAATSGPTGPGKYLVFFDFDRAVLRPDARRTVAAAAQEYQRTGAARLALSGYADLAGTDAYNAALSMRRAAAVRRELIRLGVPAGVITEVAEGERDPLVQTADGVREPRNRRVEIEIPEPVAPVAPGAVAAAVAPVPAAAEPPPPAEERRGRKKRFTFTLGPVYGYNFHEQDEGSSDNQLIGGELVFNALPGFLGGLSLKQGGFYAFNGENDGLVGRSVLSLDFAPDLGFVRPRLSLNGGGVYGEGVQDGFVAGPELALDVNLPGGFTLRPKVAYDYQFRNEDWDDGIIWGGLDLGIGF